MASQADLPLIIAFVGDLMFTVRIQNVVQGLGYRVQFVGDAGEFGGAVGDQKVNRPGESISGRDGNLFDQITRWQPALLIFDLANDAIPWQRWLSRLKSSPATRRLPVLCYGPHVEVALLERARSLGADEVVARSRFTSAMPQLIEKLARLPDHDALTETCAEPIAELAVSGIEKMNAGQFYPAHDDLEEAWVEDQGPGRDLYRAILQITVAYYQIERGNYNGAVKMFLRARQWLDPLPDVCRGVDVARLRTDAEAAHQALVALGREEIDSFDPALFRPVRYGLE